MTKTMQQFVVACVALATALTPTASIAASADDLRDLVGVRAAGGESEVESRGWHHTSQVTTTMASTTPTGSRKPITSAVTTMASTTSRTITMHAGMRTVPATKAGAGNGARIRPTVTITAGAAVMRRPSTCPT
jgi:hypothetical protein